MAYIELAKSIAPQRGIPVIPLNLRLPVGLHARVQRAVGELMVQTGTKVSQNAVLIALISDGLERLENQDNGSGSL